MKVKVFGEFREVAGLFEDFYGDYNVVEKSYIGDDVFFFVSEKFFFRNSSRASLSLCLVNKGTHLEAVIVGSGGGQGLIFRFDWGAGASFEKEVTAVLNRAGVRFEIMNDYGGVEL